MSVEDKFMAICAAEFELLSGLPDRQFRLYMVLRWFMDLRTGLVGVVRGISRQMLSEYLFVETDQGRHAGEAGSPSSKAVRCALDGLIRSGLIQRAGSAEKLVFLLPKAARASARPKHEGPMRGRGQRPDERPGQTQTAQGFATNEGPDEGPGVNADEGPTSEVISKPLSVNPSGFQRESAQRAKRATRGSRLSAEWELPEEWQGWAFENRPDLDVDQVASAFKDYWLAKAGSGAVKVDWFAAWRNWCRREKRSSERGYQDRVARQMESLFPNSGGRVIDIKEVRRG